MRCEGEEHPQAEGGPPAYRVTYNTVADQPNSAGESHTSRGRKNREKSPRAFSLPGLRARAAPRLAVTLRTPDSLAHSAAGYDLRPGPPRGTRHHSSCRRPRLRHRLGARAASSRRHPRWHHPGEEKKPRGACAQTGIAQYAMAASLHRPQEPGAAEGEEGER